MHGPRPCIPKKKGSTRHLTRHESMYEVRSAGLKGLGVFAKSSIPRGTRILSERPLLAIRQDQGPEQIFAASRLLSAKDRAKLLALSHYATKEYLLIRWSQALKYTVKKTILAILGRISSPRGRGATFPGLGLKGHVVALSIFRSNSFNLGPSSMFRQALFASISRINHSCVPNAQGSFQEEVGKFNVHATRDIGVDEELTLNYLQESGAVRRSRQSRLLDRYGFICNCPACDVDLESGRKGESRRLELHQALGEYAEFVTQSGLENPKKEVVMIKKLIELLEADGVAGRELANL